MLAKPVFKKASHAAKPPDPPSIQVKYALFMSEKQKSETAKHNPYTGVLRKPLHFPVDTWDPVNKVYTETKDVHTSLEYFCAKPVGLDARTYLSGEKQTKKGEMSPLKNSVLSNMFQCFTPLEYDGFFYNSSEAAWQAQRLQKCDRYKLALGGVFSSFAEMKKDDDASEWWKSMKKKEASWNGQDGIIAKMATRDADKLGMWKIPDHQMDPETERDVFIGILMQKYTVNKAPRKVLIHTGDVLLLEFVKGLGRETVSSHWGGLYTKWNAVRGNNKMGKYMMDVRGKIREMFPEEDQHLEKKKLPQDVAPPPSLQPPTPPPPPPPPPLAWDVAQEHLSNNLWLTEDDELVNSFFAP
jgi:predicted NAD-dependent protein-ADP-ribosyltransferase YbiA (DUF1768 family)